MKNEDEIESEIPVYVSSQLAGKLYVFQTPQPIDRETVLKASVKPRNKEVCLELKVNRDSTNFSKTKERQLTGGKRPQANGEGKIDRHFLVSKGLKSGFKYCMIAVKDTEAYLTPIVDSLQLRPQLRHVDESDSSTATAASAKSSEPTPGPSSAAGSSEEQVTVRFARSDSEQQQKNREKSYQFISQRSAEEPWCETKWQSSKSDLSHRLRRQLVSEASPVSEQEESDVVCSHDDRYVGSLMGRLEPPQPAPSLVDRCREIARSAGIVGFDQVMQQVGRDHSQEAVLRALVSVAYLVRGNWVVRSEVLYPKGHKSNAGGVPSEQMCRARDKMLYLFATTEQEHLKRSQLAEACCLPDEDLREMLAGVARREPSRGWRLLRKTDVAFLEKHPDLVQRQTLILEQKGQQTSRRRKHTSSCSDGESGRPSKRAALSINS